MSLSDPFVVPLGHTAKFLPKRCFPDLCCGWVFHELLVTEYCFARYGVHHQICVVLKVGRYLLDVVLLECDRNERGFYFHLFLDCEGVYCLLCDNSMPGPCWKRLCCGWRCQFPEHFLVNTRLVGIFLGVSVCGIGCTLLISGNFPGVLFCVTLL